MPPHPEKGRVFSLSELRDRHRRAGDLYLEFLRVPALSAGFYALPRGGVDPQTPHREDEVYYVIRGRATIQIDGTDHPVEAGSTIFVAKGVDHRFHSVTEALEVLVVFAPAESLEPPPGPSSAPKAPEGAGKVS